MEFFSNSPVNLVFGTGLGEQLVNGGGAHNTYIDFIYYLGITGTIGFFVVISQIIKLNVTSIRRNFLNYSIVLLLIIMYFFLSELQYFDLPFHISLALMVYNMDQRNDCYPQFTATNRELIMKTNNHKRLE